MDLTHTPCLNIAKKCSDSVICLNENGRKVHGQIKIEAGAGGAQGRASLDVDGFDKKPSSMSLTGVPRS